MLKALLVIPFFLVSCAGYQIGGSKPTHLAHVQSIYVPLFKNDTQFVRAGSHATNSAVDALARDGTYKIASAESSDAVLAGRVSEIEYRQVSSSRGDSLRSEELGLKVTISWTLRDANDASRILEKGESRGSSEFFARGNINTARTNALPDALRRACESMTARLADGF